MSERHSVTLRLEPPTRLALLWYRTLGIDPPLTESRNPLTTDLARLVPYGRRDFHRRFAFAMGYFWIPCPLCDRPFGGHEWGESIPDPTRAPYGEVGICSQCTIERNRETP